MNFAKAFKSKIVLSSIAEFYWSGEYEILLKHITGPLSDKSFPSVCIDIFRIMSLKNVDDERWMIEYGLFLKKEKLNIFAHDEYNYIKAFLLIHLLGTIDAEPAPKILLKNVSKNILKYLPFNKWDTGYKHLVTEE